MDVCVYLMQASSKQVLRHNGSYALSVQCVLCDIFVWGLSMNCSSFVFFGSLLYLVCTIVEHAILAQDMPEPMF